MSTRIDLLRHGETERGGGFRGSLDDALTAHGWQQMRDAVALAGPWDVLVSSPLQRCAAFARELAADRRLPLRIEPELRELHFGAWEGRSAAELMSTDAEALGRFWADPTVSRRPVASRCCGSKRAYWRPSSACACILPADACWSSVTPG